MNVDMISRKHSPLKSHPTSHYGTFPSPKSLSKSFRKDFRNPRLFVAKKS